MKLRKLLSVILTLMGAAVMGIIAPSPAFAADSGPWQIWPYSAIFSCMEVQGGSTANSAQVQIWRCPSFDGKITPLHHRWIFRNTTDGYYRLVNGKSGKCANIKGSTDANSTKIIQYTCGTSNLTLNDQWYPLYIRNVNADLYQLRSRLNYGKCLNVQGNGTANGTDLILYTCSTANNMLWSWSPAKQA
jgi:hypothetical protein